MIHFIRPDMFYLFIPVGFLIILMLRSGHHIGQWQQVCDAHLLKHLSINMPGKHNKWPVWIFAFGLSLAVLSMAGPSWRKMQVPVFSDKAPLVILLDLSNEIMAKDIQPTRLARAKYKIIDLLKARKSGQTALIAFTSEAFVVSPLTEDGKTIVNLLQVLEPKIMPVHGRNIKKALAKATDMIQQAYVQRGQILLITNRVDQKDYAKLDSGFHISVLGVGTLNGAPLTNSNGQLLKDDYNNLRISKLDAPSLKRLAKAGGGVYQAMTADNSDVDKLTNVFKVNAKDPKESKMQAQLWQDEGHWFILMLLPLMLIVFRRGYL